MEDAELIRKFVIPEVMTGKGCMQYLPFYLENFGIHHPLVVSDRHLADEGLLQPLLTLLDDHGISYTTFLDVTPNPRDHEVMAGVEIFVASKCDAIISYGGGSPTDCAKGIGIVATNGGHILQYEGVDNIPVPCPPLLCVPTTSGAAADVSQFAIITASGEGRKIAIVSKMLVPDVSFVDYETTITMDAELTAATGMDVLVHAYESLVSNASSPITRMHSCEAIRLVFEHLPIAFREPENETARDSMALASMLAGFAFSNASLGVVHAMAHSLGGHEDLPHGVCNALLLQEAFRFNYSFAIPALRQLAPHLDLPVDLSDAALFNALDDRISQLRESLNLQRGFGSLGVTRSMLPKLTENALKDPCMLTNPREATYEDVLNLYEKTI